MKVDKTYMIPIKLELKNFLSYGDPLVVIEFSNYDLICLSGKNGNGKSALLDAMTWVLWGQARKVSGNTKADAGLVRLGQTRMMVSMEFFCNNQRYRVRREYAKTYGKPVVSLDIELFNVANNDFSSFTEKTIRQTQEKIEKVVGLDFDTFINSAFLRQGQSNEFSQKTPKERKQILANILGLSKYDALQKLALERVRHYVDDQKMFVKLQGQALLELEQEKDFSDKFFQKKKELKQIEKQVVTTTDQLEEKEKEKVTFLEQKYRIEQLEKEEKQQHETIIGKQNELQELIVLWKQVHLHALQSPNIKILEKERSDLLKKDRAFREQQQVSFAVQEKLVRKEQAYEQAVVRKQQEHEKTLHELRLTFKTEELMFKQVLDQIKQKEELLAQNKKKQEACGKDRKLGTVELSKQKIFYAEFEKIKQQFEKRRVFYQNLVQRGNWAQAEIKDLEHKKRVVHDKKSPSCPLCDQVLTLRRKEFLAKTFCKQDTFLQNRLLRIRCILKDLKAILFEQHKQVQKLSFQDDRYKQLQARQEQLEKTLVELENEHKHNVLEIELFIVCSKKAQESLEKKCALVEKQEKAGKLIDSDRTIVALLKEVKALRKEKEAVAYDKKEHDAALKDLETKEQKLKLLDQLKEQLMQQQGRKNYIAKLCAELKKLKENLIALQEKRKSISCHTEQEKFLEKKLEEIKAQQQQLRKEKESLLQEISSLKTTLSRFDVLKKERREREGKIKICATQAKEYQTLAAMFGKDGIQALLIEETIPEIEQEANQLLSRLTDNKSQIFIESLRDLKKGGVRESLDIHISDEAGIRPYEMFSGGEAFRIDFALRIAISKLLARRAGTALQTLIIDEGFGPQDEEGLQRLMDAIYAIKKDFVKIIVVSHLPIFKDNFPAHFIVEKDSLGSFVRVEERG